MGIFRVSLPVSLHDDFLGLGDFLIPPIAFAFYLKCFIGVVQFFYVNMEDRGLQGVFFPTKPVFFQEHPAHHFVGLEVTPRPLDLDSA